MVFIFFLIWTPFVFRRWILPLFPISSEPVSTQKLDSIATELSKNVNVDEEKSFIQNQITTKHLNVQSDFSHLIPTRQLRISSQN
ncbi:hypothetical protein [Dyadobacter sp. NIV53]|uniref:hypothetical protein n=1 Tax=Dyadobacter sp. NIV53 TaxID=2861765 RepID=UPI001E5D375D|nr:hypothetical protein [Dyadobacter sp. NIV53]